VYGHKLSSGMGRTTRRFRGIGDTAGDTAACPSIEQQQGIFDLSDPCQNGSALLNTLPVTGSVPANSTGPSATLSSLQLQAAAATSTLPSWALPAAGIAVVMLLLAALGGRR
jgi:hypothetical protein